MSKVAALKLAYWRTASYHNGDPNTFTLQPDHIRTFARLLLHNKIAVHVPTACAMYVPVA
jgi:hypothetical protein